MAGTFTQQAIGWGPGARGASPVQPNFGQQPPEAGNLLVCIVFAGGSTKTAFNCALATGSGWTQRLSIGNDPANTQSMCGISVWTKISAGGELYTDQSFSFPAGWTGQASVHEIFGSNGEVPDITGTWSGGNTAIARTNATVSVSSTSNPSDPNEVILATYGFWCGSTGTASYTKSANMTQITDRDDTMNQQYHWFTNHLTPNTFPGGQAPTGSPFTDSSTCTVPGSSVACGLIIGFASASNPQPTVPDGQIYPATYPGGVTRTSGQSTLAVNVLNIGSLCVLATKVSAATNSVTGVSDSAGILTGWSRVVANFTDSGNQSQDIWIARSTGTGNTTLTLTFQAAIGSTANDAQFAEFYPGYPGTYARDGTQSASQNNASSGTWNFPALTAARPNEIYIGHARGPAGGPFRNFLPNGVNLAQDGNNNPLVYWAGLASGAMGSGPYPSSLNATVSYAAGALIQASLTWTMAGSSATVSSSSGTLGTAAATVGSSVTGSTGSGTVTATLALSGSSTAVSAASGALYAVERASGSSATVSSASGALSNIGALSGSSATASVANGTISGVGTLIIAGSSATASVGTGTLLATLIISGSSATVSSANGSVGFISAISGTSVSVSVGSGAFIAGPLSINGLSVSPSEGNGWLLPLIFVPPTGGSDDYVWVEILDANLVRQGVIQFATITAQLYYNAVGSWSMTVPYSDFLWKIMMAGDFFVNINWRGLFSFGGKCEQPGYSDSIPGSTGSSVPGPYITLSGADYLALIANRIVYPTPANAWSAQTAAGTDPVSNVPLETAIKHYVNNNVGPAAIASRRIAPLSIATDQGRGSNISYTAKFVQGGNLNLMDVIRALIAQAGSGNAMGVSVARQASTHSLLFDCYVPRNLSGKAWFSRDLGNLTAISFSLTDPTCTDALVQGSGTNFIQRTASNKTQYNQTEQFIDSSSETDTNNLNSTAQQAILSGAAGPTLSATLADTPYLTFGRDYGLGDIVTIEVRPGNTYSDVITGVTLTADPSQTPMISAVPTVGQNANATATDQSIIGQLTKRIRTLERRLRILWLSMTHGLRSLTSYQLRPNGNIYSQRFQARSTTGLTRASEELWPHL